MIFSASQLLACTLLYLTLLFTVGWLAERGRLPAKLLNHPAIYVLSLGAIAGGLAIYGASQMARQYGNAFLLYYIGIGLMLLLSPLLMFPVMRICRIYQLSSLPDLLTFRFRSPWIGALVTVTMVAAMLPLLALQMQLFSDAVHLLGSSDTPEQHNAFLHNLQPALFCVLTVAFTVFFGSRRLKAEDRHQGLVTTIAFESAVKLVALFIVGLYAAFAVFNGPADIQQWLRQNPAAMGMNGAPLRGNSAHMLLLLFFAGAITMPHSFHMAFSENPDGRRLRVASWGLPLYLLLLSLPILPITWAALKLETGITPAYSALAIGIETGSPMLSLVAFLAGASAASAVIIVSTLALANMVLKHLILPLQLRGSAALDATPDIYSQLTWLRATLIAAIIVAGYLFFLAVGSGEVLVDLGLAAFIGTLQFLPGLLATIYWPRANRMGLTAGLAAGFLTWYVVSVLPLLGSATPEFIVGLFSDWTGYADSGWTRDIIASLGINVLLFVLVSMLTPMSREESASAEICSMDDLIRPLRRSVGLNHPTDFERNLAEALGEQIARAEVERALKDLRLNADESRPYALRQLRDRIEANLSGLLGPAVAFDIMQRCIPYQLDAPGASEDLGHIERRLDSAYPSFQGLAAELDSLRRYHRETLRNLPIGVLSLDQDGEVLMWNRVMEELTGIDGDEVVGSYLSALPGTWSNTLGEFASSDKAAEHKLHLPTAADSGRWISLHKADVESSSGMSEDQVILVEDLTDYEILEQELMHSERLASIGRLAAGVAHEIGNPVTGIACLAQNLEVEDDIEAVPDAAAEIRKQTERVSRIVESLVNFAHTGRDIVDTETLQAVNVADCIDEAIHLLQLDLNAKTVRFDNRCNREHLVLAESQRLLQVFINLLGNARDASESGGLIELDAEVLDQTVTVSVTDHGCGIPDTVQSQIFEPFFTTKDPGEGTGLGLAMVYSILEALGGKVAVQSPLEAGRGTCFSVTLSRASYGDEYR